MELLDQIRANIRAALDTRSTAQTDLDAILAAAAAENRTELNETEAARFAELRTALTAADEEITALRAREAELVEIAEARAAADRLAAELPDRPGGGLPQVRVGDEPRIYREGGEHSFFADLYAAQITNDQRSWQNIHRHQDEMRVDGFAPERRDTTTTSYGGIVPPQYLVEMFAPIARAGRPFANALNSLPLPAEGMSFTIPRVTTGNTAANTAENSGFSEQDMAETDLTFRAELITSQQDISRAAFTRAGSIVDQVIFPDQIAAYAAALDSNILNGSGTTPNHRGVLNVSGINAVTYTDASPTVPELWSKLADAIQQVNTNRLLPATFILMHPRRWGWLNAALDTTGRPLLPDADEIPMNAVGVGKAAEYGQVVGTLQGLPVITDANIPTNLGAGTNEDRIIVIRGWDALLWEDNGGDPVSFTFEQTQGPQTVRLAVGGFSGFTAGRYPTAISVIAGTGLVGPTF